MSKTEYRSTKSRSCRGYLPSFSSSFQELKALSKLNLYLNMLNVTLYSYRGMQRAHNRVLNWNGNIHVLILMPFPTPFHTCCVFSWPGGKSRLGRVVHHPYGRMLVVILLTRLTVDLADLWVGGIPVCWKRMTYEHKSMVSSICGCDQRIQPTRTESYLK